jgi:hypothetical protein
MPITLVEYSLDESAYQLLQTLSTQDYLPIKTKDLIEQFDQQKLHKEFPKTSVDRLKARIEELLSIYPNTYSFLCAYNQIEKAQEIAKKIKAHQAFIADCLNSGTETIKKREDLSSEQILLLENLEKMSSWKRDDLPDKEANEEYRAHSCAYWLARAKGHEIVADSVAQSWLEPTQNRYKEEDITQLNEIQRVLNDVAYAGDIQNLTLLWQLVASSAENRNSARTGVIASACKTGKISVLNVILTIPEEKTALTHYLRQEPFDLFVFMRSACKSGNQETIEWVVDLAKESNQAHQLFEITPNYNPLAEACASGNHDAVLYVLANIPDEHRLRAITQPSSSYFRDEPPNYAIEQACFSGNPQVLNLILEALNEEQITEIFSPNYQPANRHPLNYAQGIAITDTIFSKMPLSWTASIIDSAVYTWALTTAYSRNELEQASYLLDKVPDEKLASVLDALNSQLDSLVLDDNYSIEQRDKEMFTVKINDYKNLRNELAQTKLSSTAEPSIATTSQAHSPSQASKQVEVLPSMRLPQSSLFYRALTSESEEESSKENTKQKKAAASGCQ